MTSERVLKAALQYAGLFLVLVMFSEEFGRLVTWFWRMVRQYPRLRVFFYPLATLFVIGAAALIANSLITLFFTVLFSYD
jgi:hypothetical protein